MPLKVLVVAMVFVSLLAFGQAGAGNNPVVQPVVTMPAIPNTVPIGNGLGSTAGTVGYYGDGLAGGAVLSTPSATFESMQPTAGISNAGRAGISNLNPVNTAVQSSLNNSTVVYSNVGVYTNNIETEAEAPAGASPATSAVSPDYGASFFSNEVGANGRNLSSLGEIAARYRDLQGTRTVRTYTNADIRPPETFETALAANRPPVLPQTGSSTSPQIASASPGSSTNAWQSQEQGANTAAQPQQTELPASSTMLPLLGLLGLASAGIGFLLRGRRVELRG